jgi:hypothetical protein
VTTAKSRMYEAADESKVQPIINKGVNLGLSGDDLIKYVREQARGNTNALRHGADKETLDFSRDVLYKRAFSGGSRCSVGLRSYALWPSRALAMCGINCAVRGSAVLGFRLWRMVSNSAS